MTIKIHLIVLCIIGMLSTFGGATYATEAWTPDTGTINLDERPNDDPEARFHRAAALLTTGETRSAAKQLDSLLAEHPQARWTDKARYLLGMAQFKMGRYRKAFATWQIIQEKHPENKRREQIFELQKKTVNKLARDHLDDSLPMYDDLVHNAHSQNAGARAQRDKADALYRARRYLHASDQYLALIDYFPGSTLVPYAWYRIGVCELEMARWLGRGTQRLSIAIARFEDFLANFPDNRLAGKARDKLQEARTLRAQKYARIARYYMDAARRPAGALPYLKLITDSVPETELGQWARSEMPDVIGKRDNPPRGQVEPMPLPGVATSNQ